MNSLFTPAHFAFNALKSTLFGILFLMSFSVFSQNPTVINDSLVVNQRLYAKEKLIVDKEAKFKQDVVINGDLRIKSDLRIDSTLRVDGAVRFLSNVKMEGLGYLATLDSSAKFIIVQPNGQLKTVGLSQMNQLIYEPYLCTGGDVPLPQWSNGLNKIYSACDIVRVGIGTTTPDFKLHVVGINYAQKFLAGNSGATTDALLNLYAQNNTQDLVHVGIKIGGLAQEMRFTISNKGAVDIKNTGGTASITIHNGTGNALLAYSNAGTKILQLEDNGMLRAREVKVDEDNWPDYVFEKNYQLPSLTTIADYISEYHHLPGVPSQTEIENDGLNLGDMQKIQMQKIEELTLYLIEMEEKMKGMEERMNALEEENEELKKIVK